MKILYTVITYKRPKMLRNTIKSIVHEGWMTQTWGDRLKPEIEIVVIDDCEAEALDLFGANIALSDIHSYYGIRIIQPGDTLDQKKNHTASRVGWGLNKAVQESDADLVMMLCDDDLVYPWASLDIIEFFKAHPDEEWGWGSVCPYDAVNCDYPTISVLDDVQLIDGAVVPAEGNNRPPGIRDVPFLQRLTAANRLDISQVVWRRQSQIDHNIRWSDKSHPVRQPIDHMIFHQMDNKFHRGCPNMDMLVQYKGSHATQISQQGVKP